MAKRGISVGVKLDGDAKGFKSAAEDAKRATEKLNKNTKKAGQGIHATFRKITMAVAPIGIAIGALVGAWRGLKNILTGTVEGQERMAKVMGYAKGIMSGLKDVLISISEKMIKAFSDPRQAIINLGDAIKNNFVIRFRGMVDMVVAGWEVISSGAKGVGLAIAGIFDKDLREKSKIAFDEMKTGMSDFGEATIQAITGVEDFTKKVGDKISSLAKDINDRAKKNAELAQREFNLEKKKVDNIVTLARLQREIEESKEIARDIDNDTQTQLDAQLRAMELIAKEAEIKKSLAAEELQIERMRMALYQNTLEDERKEKELVAELENIEANRAKEARTMYRYLQTLRNRLNKTTEETIENVQEEANVVDEVVENLSGYEGIVNGIEGAFNNFFSATDQGFKGMVKGFTSALKQMAAQMAAKAAMFAILNLLTGGTGGFAKVAKGLVGTGGLKGFMGFAKGGIVSSPMVAKVGEYSGVKHNPEVIAPLSKLKDLITHDLNINISGKISGRDIYLSGNKYAENVQKNS